jgi:hypothetical protein
MPDKSRLIERICRISEEKPEFLANFSLNELLDYAKHLERLRKTARKPVLIDYRD